MKKIIFASGAYIAAVVGAGFASGQETVSFFVRYGHISFFGVIISALLFGAFAYCVSDGMRRNNAADFEAYVVLLMGGRVSATINILVRLFMTVVFIAMISGGTVLLYEVYDIPPQFAALMICAVCALVFISGNRMVLAVNSLLGMLICISVVFSCIYILNNRDAAVLAGQHGKWAISAFSYAGYNILTAGGVMNGLGMKTKRESAYFGLVSAGMMLAMMLCMWVLLSIYSGKIYLGELPLLTLAMRTGTGITIFFSAILFSAMITTALSVGLGILPQKHGILKPLLLCVMGYIASGISFSFVVDVIYRLCGYIGNILLMIIIINQIKYEILRKIKKNRGNY